MLPFFADRFGNPSSAHQSGQRARSAVERARGQVAALLGCMAREVVFTSGGTEADNLALAGLLMPALLRGENVHLVTTAIEHHAVLYTAEAMERQWGRRSAGLGKLDVTYLAPERDGVVRPEALRAALRPETRLVSVMLANNETGAIQPVGKMARVAKAYDSSILVHTDAVQAVGKLPIDLSGEFKNVDLLSISGHKLYGPQGTGALFVRKGLELHPLFHGGPHERQRRAGTENVAGIVGLGRAAQSAQAWLGGTPSPGEGARSALEMAAWRDAFETAVLGAIAAVSTNALGSERLGNTSNLCFAGIDAESLVIALDLAGVEASFGAACQSGATEPSHVLLAMGLTPAQARASVRFSMSRLTTQQEMERAAKIVIATVARLRSLQPSAGSRFEEAIR